MSPYEYLKRNPELKRILDKIHPSDVDTEENFAATIAAMPRRDAELVIEGIQEFIEETGWTPPPKVN